MKKNINLLVTNETKEMVSFTFNLKADKAQTRYETLEGKQHLVVPCVMMTEGVHNGSQGPLYYSAEELSNSKILAIWNGKPVVVYHPEMNGLCVSACDPVIFETYKIGLLFNTQWEDGKLKTECWIDEEKANKVDDRILEAIGNGTMMEVSTGVFIDREKVEGEWNGEHYDFIARNCLPDHLAILPDKIGACSIEDGAGLLRNAQGDETAGGRLARSLYKVFNELSHSEIWQKLNEKVGKDAWVTDVFEKFFIYDTDSDQMFYQEYEIVDDEVKLIGIRKEVEKIVQYKMLDGGTIVGNISIKELEMKKKIVDAMIANEKSAWTEEDREFLMGISDEKLSLHSKAMEEEEAPKKKEKKKEETKPADPKVEKKEETTTENQEPTMEQYIANAPEGMRDVLLSGVETHKAQKASLIQKITANERSPFSKEDLESKKLGELIQLEAYGRPATVPADPVPADPFFGGLGEVVPVIDNTEQEEEPLEMPVVVNEEKE